MQEAQQYEGDHDILEQAETPSATLNVLCEYVMRIWETNARIEEHH
jgi:hypothetical protein